MSAAGWWVVMLPAESADLSELFGPYRSETAAHDVADKWNRNHPTDPATVLPIQPAREMQ